MLYLKVTTEDILTHFGTKGMKWGVRKKKDQINSKDRVIKKGTEIQNISSTKLTKKRHMYSAYTKFDKESYVGIMYLMYGKEVYQNSFKVKKDIKVPSDKKLVEEFTSLAKSNPKLVAEDMAKAYNHVHRFTSKTSKHFEKKLSKIPDDYSKKGEKTTARYVQLMVSDEASRSRAKFFGALAKQGYDGMSDTNDRDGGAKDPLIVFNVSKNLNKTKTVKLSEDTLEAYYRKVSFDEKFAKTGKNLKDIQQTSIRVTTEDILQHHGVKGMKWGVRKKEISSRREAKAVKLDNKASTTREQIKNLNSQPDGFVKRQTVKHLTRKEIQAVKDSVAVREGKMTRREKQVAVGAAVVAVAGAYVIGAKVQSGEMNALIMKGQEFLGKEASSFKKSPLYARNFDTPEQLHSIVTRGINDHSKIGGKVNCRRCTMAYEMRRRGLDVQATRTTTGSGQAYDGLYNSINKTGEPFVNGRISMIKRYTKEYNEKEKGKRTETPFMDFVSDDSAFKKAGYFGEEKISTGTGDMGFGIFNTLSKQPDKARGELSFSWTGGGAHSVAWEIVKGKPVIIDTQTGKMFKDLDSFEYGKNIKDAGFTRLDNKDLNEEFLKRWVKNAN